ncbi:IS200/IS605 family transposase [Mongoliibacter ruber]|uniref:REP element-mobilizing transposase RayT n=1 Tax=Mongoliibacter ruber TaxID=1750599 RepID=A0A2T0WI34_9BACT|nr:IS200/IS605 family transposase [Mongoliibacter ruber]PRY86346.1 REP element-mobilizing transposase RayT [Mongoliibacter ruber]
MANSFTQVHVQSIFAVKYRYAVISSEWEEELYKYITGIIQNRGHKMLAINGMPDHIHIFFGLRMDQSISNLVQEVKIGSMNWINKSGFCRSKFYWQNGYSAFSYSKSHVESVIRYIQNQKQHHKKENFLEEYRNILLDFEIPFEEKYLFRSLE